MDAHQTQIYTAVLITCILVGTLIFYFAVSIVRQQRRALELHRRNVLTEINTLEKERTRMAADLHDDLGPTLSFIKYQIDGVETKDPADQEQLIKACNHLDAAVTRIREISHNLMPTVLTRKGIAMALREIADHTSEHQQLQVLLDYKSEYELSEERSINVFRVLQEVIQNCVKHATAQNLLIQVYEENGTLKILCEDDGKGFDVHAAGENGIGLRNIRSRVELMGGKLKLFSEKGRGTQYFITIPIPN